MRGIIAHGAYLPHRRLDRSTIRAVAGSGGGTGTRTVAGFDEDTTTMGVEAARLALRPLGAGAAVGSVVFSTVAPAYLDKTNATAIHAALGLDPVVAAIDAGGAVRSAAGALRLAFGGGGPTLVVTADLRTGLPGSVDEAQGGDGAAAVLIGDGEAGEAREAGDDGSPPVLAELLGVGAATEEFVDRWRTPGDIGSKHWEERFGELSYTRLGAAAWTTALAAAGLEPGAVDHLALASVHPRAARTLPRSLGLTNGRLADDLSGTVGLTGAAHPLLLLSSVLERAEPGQIVVLLSLADGADAFVLRTTEALARFRPARPVADQLGAGRPVDYGRFLAWRGLLPVEPPRRPEPARVSASAAARGSDWKFGLVGSQDRTSGALHLPPQRASMVGDAIDDMEPVPMADAVGTIVTHTVDRLAYSPSPPVVFAVVDFDGGGRLPIELTDVDPSEVAIGGRVEMTFRRLHTADGIHNYFWKARPIPTPASAPAPTPAPAGDGAAASTPTPSPTAV